MPSLLIALAIYLLSFFSFMLYLIKKAPTGYHDKSGFHYGDEK